MAAPGVETAAPAPERFPVKIWLITFAGWLFDFYDLVLISYLLIPVGHDLALTHDQQSILLGAALGASGIGGIAGGYLSDRFGRRRVMSWTILLYSAGTLLTAASWGFTSLLVFRLLTGLGLGGEWAVGHALLAESTPRSMRGRASAMLQAGEPVGVGLAALVGLFVAPLLQWRAVFALSSATALIAVVVRRHLPESPLWHEQRPDQLSPGQALAFMKRHHLVAPGLKGFLLGVFKLGTYWTCYIWLPKLLQEELQQPVARSALWLLTAQVGQLLGMLAFGAIADRHGRRVAFTGYSLLTAAALYPLAFHCQELLAQPGLFWADMFALGLGSGCTAGFGALLAELFPTEVRNFAMGTTYHCARAVQFLAPIGVGAAKAAGGVTGALSVPIVLALLTASWVWVLPETRHRNLARVEG
jgi:MFS family permease